MKLLDLTEAFWQNSAEGCLFLDNSRSVVAINSAAEDLLNQTSEKLLGRPIIEILPMIESKYINHGKFCDGETVSVGDKKLGLTAISMAEKGTLILLWEVTQQFNLKERLAETERWNTMLTIVFDTAYEGIVIVDEKARITTFNQAYADFLGVNREDMIGKPVVDVVENTRLHEVLRSGKPEYRQIQRIKGHDMVCDRIPIWEGNRIVGAVGKVLFRDISEVDDLQEQAKRLKLELEFYKGQLRRQELQAKYTIDNIIGQSQAIKRLKELIFKVGQSKSTVLIRGESGTGKELVAHSIHNASAAYRGPFIKVNCGAIPENLLESELFGYEEGAFTGAKKGGKIGKFEQANGGTIFLDEIGELPLGMQVKLLRVLQEKEIERVGGNRTIKVDVRVISATHRNLEQLVQEGTFRQDLFYRLNVMNLEIPPLRRRPEDIPILIEYFLDKLGRILGCGKKKLTPETSQLLLGYDWPGNVRELENVIERALNIVEGEEILPEFLPKYVLAGRQEPCTINSLKESLARLERELLQKSLSTTGGNVLEAAKLVGLSKSTFYERITRYGLR